MADSDVDALLFGALLDPGEAAGVAGGDDARAGRFEIFEFAVEELAGHFGFGDVIDAGAAATGVGLVHLDQFQAGD